MSLQRNSAGPARPEEAARPCGNLQPRAPLPGAPAGHLSGSRPQSLGVSGPGQPALPRDPLHTGPPGRPGSSAILGSGLGSKPPGGSRRSTLGLGLGTPKPSHSPGSTALGRISIAQLPRIPKIRQDGGTHSQDGAPAQGQDTQLPSACISRLTGKEGPGQPGQGARREGAPSNRGPQEPSSHAGSSRAPAPSSHCSLPPLGPSRGKGVGSTFESFRVNIPGNMAPTGRLASPGFCNTFRPVDSKVQRKENSSPLFSIKKTKQLKSEIYDPFEPTGSDSSPPSSPESLGSALLPSEITRTISVRSPKAPPLQAVRCVTSYTVEGVFEAEASRGPCPSALQLRAQEATEEEEERPLGSLTSAAPEPWDEHAFFSSEERTVTRVTILEPDGPPSPDMPQETTHRVVELRSSSRSISRSRSRSSSRSRRKAKKKRVVREHRRTRSRTHSGSRDRSERSMSPAATDSPPRRRRAKARSRRSSSERSSSHERTKRKKAKGKDRRRDGRGRRRTRSRSGSPHSSSYEHRDSRRKKRQRSESRSRSGDYSPASSLERGHRHKRQRERSRERPDRRDSNARPRERRKQRSRSPSSEHRVREPQPQSSQEKRPLALSPEENMAITEASPAPPPPGEPPAGLPAPAGTTSQGVTDCRAAVQEPPALSLSAEAPADDLDYGDSVEAGHVFEDFSSDAILTQLDDMSSPPSPESTDSSPERDLLPKPTLAPATWPLGTSLPTASTQAEVSLTYREGTSQLPLPAQGVPEQRTLGQDPLGMVSVDKTDSAASGKVHEVPGSEQAWQAPLLRSRALVKRVTWNLQEPAGSAAADRAPRAPLHRPQRSREGAWDTEDVTPAAATLAPLPELPPPSHALPEPVFLGADPSQVYSPYVPPALAPPANLPPYVPASQPTVQLVLQGSLPLAGCGLGQSLAAVPTALATTTEPGSQATNSEERMATPKPGLEKTKKEEYMKKLHMQERAVEEVKLAIKPFYQRREVSKDEYKDILRKAVQKICHSKSGEINPVKVANLVKAYVDKYRHMRRHKKAEASAEPPTQGTEA